MRNKIKNKIKEIENYRRIELEDNKEVILF